jgi:transposase-like protein
MPLKLKDIHKKSSDVIVLIRWLIELCVLIDLEGRTCGKCEIGKFGLRKDATFFSDGHVWRCLNKKCNKKIFIRLGSWFEKHILTLENFLLITYFWVYKASEIFVRHELDICRQTVVDWYNFSRQVCTSILEINSEKLGGPGKIVEIDESKFGKRKFHKGRRVDGVWVFGGIERETKWCFFTTVSDRTRETLLEIIKQNILPGTTIISDCWRAYDILDKEGFEHLKVNHSLNFVDPETGAHTNTIESTWRALNKSLPISGTTKAHCMIQVPISASTVFEKKNI